MINLENDIKRKIKVRKFAIDNLGDTNFKSSDLFDDIYNFDEQLQKMHYELSENIEDAEQSKNQDGYSTIYSNKRLIGGLEVFTKKAIRKIINILFGWYIRPIFEKQSFNNGKVLNAINLLNYINNLQSQNYNEKILEMERKVELLENNNTTMHEIIKKLENDKNINDSIIKINQIVSDLDEKVNYALNKLNVTCDISLLQKNDMDYFKFEDLYRGTRSGIKDIQSVYIPYYTVSGNEAVLDIGCGRGEFLELMWDNGIKAYGIDNYDPFVKYCNERGLIAKRGDALTHLDSLEDCSLGGIFMSQVVEHLESDYVRALITAAYKKLKPGCYFILETPNPDCLAAISEFNIDISHVKPVHYKALEYLFKEANYQSVEKYHTKQSLYPIRAKHIEGEEIKNIDEFNQGIDHINELLFGYRDYTLIAKK